MRSARLPSIWYRLLYSYVNSFKAIKLTHYKRLLQVLTSLPPLEAVVDIGAGYGIIADLIHQRIGVLYLIEKKKGKKFLEESFGYRPKLIYPYEFSRKELFYIFILGLFPVLGIFLLKFF